MRKKKIAENIRNELTDQNSRKVLVFSSSSSSSLSFLSLLLLLCFLLSLLFSAPSLSSSLSMIKNVIQEFLKTDGDDKFKIIEGDEKLTKLF